MFPFVLIVLMVQLFPGMYCQQKCENSWVEYGEHCYKIMDKRVSWFQAKKICNDNGGYLVTIESWRENNWLKLQATAIYNHANAGFYIGLTDLNSEGIWKWESNDEPLAVFDFARGEPEGKRKQNCVMIQSFGKDAQPPYQFVDVDCTRKERFICEKEN